MEQDKLSSEIKEKVKVNVSRESPEDKLRDFTKWMDSVKKEVKLFVSKLGCSVWLVNLFIHKNYLRANLYTRIFVRHM